MSGIVGIVSQNDCVDDLFFMTDYHFHLGTEFGGMAVLDGKQFQKDIKKITSFPFRPQLSTFKQSVKSNKGIGVISDYEPQPLPIASRLGDYAIVHVGKVRNLESLVQQAYKKGVHFTEMSPGVINPTEVVASLINQGKDYLDGIEIMQNTIEGSSSLMLLTEQGVYAARDKYGRTPLVLGKKQDGTTAVVSETCSFPTRGFDIERFLGPGEIGIITEDGYEQLKKPGGILQFCPFMYVYFGNPGSDYEDLNVEMVRYELGRILAQRDKLDNLELDFVSAIPDSGEASCLGYTNEMKIDHKRPYVKYKDTWQRSFMGQEQGQRELTADMKLIPIKKLIKGYKILFTDDSIVRGTQLKKKIRELFDYGAKEVHMRSSCPPLTYTCDFLNFSRSKDVFDLAARRAMRKVEGREDFDITPYLDESSESYVKMVDMIRADLGLTSLKYAGFNDMVSAIGLPEEKLCGGCWKECNDSGCA